MDWKKFSFEYHLDNQGLLNDRYVESAYRNVTRRTLVRELIRLSELGFIRFTRDESVQDHVVELDFGAISRY